MAHVTHDDAPAAIVQHTRRPAILGLWIGLTTAVACELPCLLPAATIHGVGSLMCRSPPSFLSCVPPCFASARDARVGESRSQPREREQQPSHEPTESSRPWNIARATKYAETKQRSSGGLHHSSGVGIDSNRLPRSGNGCSTTCSEHLEQEQQPPRLQFSARATPEPTSCLGGEITGRGAHSCWKANEATSCNSHVDGLREWGWRRAGWRGVQARPWNHSHDRLRSAVRVCSRVHIRGV